jgi:hypothetical protein
VSTDSKRAISTTVRVPTPPSPLHESGGTASTSVVMATVVPAALTIQESETAPAAAEEIPGDEEVPAHIPNVPEDNIVESILIDESLVTVTNFGTGMTQVEHVKVAASKEPVQADVTPGSGIPVTEETLVQDPIDDISMEDIADTHDSYDVVLDEAEGHMAGAQVANMEVTAPVTTHTSPTRTGNWLFINILLLLLLDGKDFLKYIDYFLIICLPCIELVHVYFLFLDYGLFRHELMLIYCL